MTNDSDGEIPTPGDDPELWKRVCNELSIGTIVHGTVICRRPFGLFLDIGYGNAANALLLVPEFKEARNRPIPFDEYPMLGDILSASVINIDFERRTIALTQKKIRLKKDVDEAPP